MSLAVENGFANVDLTATFSEDRTGRVVYLESCATFHFFAGAHAYTLLPLHYL